jgi:hypothetical protein
VKLLFQCEQLNHRGTTNSTVDYALYNQLILGNESTIAYCSIDPPGFDVGTKPEIVEQLKQQFNIVTYETEEDLNRLAEGYDFCYSQRAGYLYEPDTKKKLSEVNTTNFGVHCVFQWYEPHGNSYAYISEWLANEITKNYRTQQQKFVPYIVTLPDPNFNLREHLGIPKDKFVIGRHGGFNTFDIPFARDAVIEFAQSRDDVVFLFCNTMPFCNLPNVLFMAPFFGAQEKSNYINACDAMLHARDLGESFGLSVAEFLYFNKPVLSWAGGFDRNHAHWLEKHNLLYRDKADLIERLHHLPSMANKDYASIVAEFNPASVMKKFNEVFLNVTP